MRVVVIGGTGHVGTYLIPRLVRLGHEVINVSRGTSRPYLPHAAWNRVRHVALDRQSEEAAGAFGARIAALEPHVVVDMICFTEESARQLVEALAGRVQHYLFCGTIWVHGPSVEVPTTESEPRRPFGEYGIRKAATEAYLLDQARRRGFPATVLHPGHIVGPGWVPLNPQGNFNPDVFSRLACGEPVLLPNLGLETVHHVHADDVAQAFVLAIENRSVALGESFHVVSPAALTLRGYAEQVAGWFGQTARLEFAPWDVWKTTVSPQDAEATWDHIAHSPNCSIAKAKRLLGYRPRYGSLDAVYESVMWLVERGIVRTRSDA
ncbi:MAG: epimerase [Candidatus Reconcilbacillus cellulovorans]|uniref:Epimerase n=1 Tax=Candidatus Reconcilbacillus cellulovorans TaxID=1906605 RepID=A0A2A6DYI3_9BACL|nr:MAG: epimerase [Candidatus Reconcilbacillus cellulovorans]